MREFYPNDREQQKMVSLEGSFVFLITAGKSQQKKLTDMEGRLRCNNHVVFVVQNAHDDVREDLKKVVFDNIFAVQWT